MSREPVTLQDAAVLIMRNCALALRRGASPELVALTLDAAADELADVPGASDRTAVVTAMLDRIPGAKS